MSALETRVKKLESRHCLTAEQSVRAMSDAELEFHIRTSLQRMTPEEWGLLQNEVGPETRELYEELRGACEGL